jgi:hypothetical protein
LRDAAAVAIQFCEFWQIRWTVYDNGNKNNTTIRKN